MLDDNGTDQSSDFDTPEGPIEDTGPDEVPEDTAAFEPGPPEGPPPQDSSGTGLTVVFVILVVGILAAGALAYKMHVDKTEANRALQRAITVMPDLAGPQAQTVSQQLADVRTALNQGRYDRVISGLESLSVPERGTGRPARGARGDEESILPDTDAGLPEGPLPEEAYADLPEDARPFFKSHEDIFKHFAMQCNVARQMRDEGMDVGDLRQVRDEIIEAARLRQEDRVQELMEKMDGMLREKAGGDRPARQRADMPPQLRKPLQNFADVARQARNERRDIRPAMELLQRAEKAAEGGDMDKAQDLIAKATSAAKDAPKMTPRQPQVRRGERRVRIQRPSQGRPPQGQQAPRVAQIILQGLMGLVSAEEADLAAAYQKIENAKIAIREKNQEQIKEILDKALAHFKRIGQRRRQFNEQTKELLAEGPPERGERSEEGEAAGPDEETGRPRQRPGTQRSRLEQMKAIVTRGALQIFDRVRSLSDEEYADRKDELAEQVFALLRGRPPQEPKPIVKDVEIKPAETEAEKAEAEARIRAKMRLAQDPYEKLQASEEDEELLSRLDELFGRARDALYDERYMEAEEFVNEGLRLLGLMEPATGAGAATPGVDELILGSDESPSPLDQPPPAEEQTGPTLKLDPSKIGSPTIDPGTAE